MSTEHTCPRCHGMRLARRCVHGCDGPSRAKPTRVHLEGPLQWEDRRGYHELAPGYPVCCSGDRAERIARAGTQTRTEVRVTCARCLSLLARAKRWSGASGVRPEDLARAEGG